MRPWLLLMTTLAGLVVFTITGLFFYVFEQRASEQLISHAVITLMTKGGRTACEASPGTWFREVFGERNWTGTVERPAARNDGPIRSLLHESKRGARLPMHAHIFAYDANLSPSNPLAPAIDHELRQGFGNGSITHRSMDRDSLRFLDDRGHPCPATAMPAAGRSGRPGRPDRRHLEPGMRDEPGMDDGPRGPAEPGGPGGPGEPDGPGGPARDVPGGPGAPAPDMDHGKPPLPGADVIESGATTVRNGCPSASMTRAPGEMRLREMLIPMPWRTGPCANILVRYDEPAEEVIFHRFSPPIGVWGLPVLFMLLTVLIAAGPVARRIVKLTAQVRRSATDRYRTPITLKGRDEIGQLASAFERARSEILDQVAQQEEREKNLRTFLENTTHDISIPLTVLQGHLSDMAGREGSLDAETVSAAMIEANYLAALIGNLSIASRIETGQPTMQQEPVNLNDVVLRCVIRHRPIARQSQVSLDHAIPENPVLARGDMTFMEQALNNVIFNAIRHNNRDGHVAVILETTADDRFNLSVLDDGPGIPDEEMSRIAERYYRCGKERGREAGNQGLGLNIAFQIAQMHAWEFSLSHSEFGGLRVEFKGPVHGSVRDASD